RPGNERQGRGRNLTSRLTRGTSRATIGAITGGGMQRRPSGGGRVFNNPPRERCDQHLRPGENLRKGGGGGGPAWHEEPPDQEPRPGPAGRRTRDVRRSGRPQR